MKKKLLSIILVIAMLICMIPLGMVSAEAATHEGFTPVSDFAGLTDAFTNGGKYYLANDITATVGLTVSKDVDLCLNGKVLDLDGKGNITVNEEVSFSLCDCDTATSHNFTVNESTDPWTLDEQNGTETVTGGVITGGATGGGGCVYVAGLFTMNGGNLYGNTAFANAHLDGHGGGVYVAESGSFTMNDGGIGGNVASCSAAGQGYGGGVYAAGSFTMNGGTVCDNVANCGGGVCVIGNGSFTMNDGTICGNSVYDCPDNTGGGVYLEGGSFTMNDGTICDNTADLGGGIHSFFDSLDWEEILTIKLLGGTICDNTAWECGGVGAYGNVEFVLGGTVVIKGNTANNQPSDLWGLASIDSDNAPEDGMEVGLYGDTTVSGASEGDEEFFFADDAEKYYAKFNSNNNEVYLAEFDTEKKIILSACEHGSLCVSGSDSITINADKIIATPGITVTVQVQPNDGYQLKSLKYNDGEDHDITSAKSFTMPASNVTVTAEFEVIPLDYTDLNAALTEAAKYDEKLYTVESWAVFTAAKTAAEALAAATDAEQEDIDLAKKALLDAIKELELKAADYSALNGAIKAAEAIDKDLYTDDSAAALESALAEAKAILNLYKIDKQDDINAAASKLAGAITGLVKKANYKNLQEKIDLAKAIVDSAEFKNGYYTAETSKALNDALDAAEAIHSGLTEKDQDMIDTIESALINAINGITLKSADLTALNTAIADAENLNKADYTAKSWDTLAKAVAEAKAAVAENKLTIKEQAAVTALKTAIEQAKAGLVDQTVEIEKKEETELDVNADITELKEIASEELDEAEIKLTIDKAKNAKECEAIKKYTGDFHNVEAVDIKLTADQKEITEITTGLLAVTISFDFNGKKNIEVIRTHMADGALQVLPLTTEPNKDGEYYEQAETGLKLYINKLCTYAVTYQTELQAKQQEATEAINEALGKNPTDEQKKAAEKAIETIKSSETVADVDKVKEESIADIKSSGSADMKGCVNPVTGFCKVYNRYKDIPVLNMMFYIIHVLIHLIKTVF